jgi:hypothetical protein
MTVRMKHFLASIIRRAEHLPAKWQTRHTRVYPEVPGLVAWSENCKWYSFLYRYFVSQSSEFCDHNLLCCLSTSVYCCKRIFLRRLSPETFGCTIVSLLLTDAHSHKSPTIRRAVIKCPAVEFLSMGIIPRARQQQYSWCTILRYEANALNSNISTAFTRKSDYSLPHLPCSFSYQYDNDVVAYGKSLHLFP